MSSNLSGHNSPANSRGTRGGELPRLDEPLPFQHSSPSMSDSSDPSINILVQSPSNSTRASLSLRSTTPDSGEAPQLPQVNGTERNLPLLPTSSTSEDPLPIVPGTRDARGPPHTVQPRPGGGPRDNRETERSQTEELLPPNPPPPIQATKSDAPSSTRVSPDLRPTALGSGGAPQAQGGVLSKSLPQTPTPSDSSSTREIPRMEPTRIPPIDDRPIYGNALCPPLTNQGPQDDQGGIPLARMRSLPQIPAPSIQEDQEDRFWRIVLERAAQRVAAAPGLGEIFERPSLRPRLSWISVVMNAIGIVLPLIAFGVLSAPEHSAIFKIDPSRYLQTLPLDDVPFVDGPSVTISYFKSCVRKTVDAPFACVPSFFFPQFDQTILPAEAPLYLITSPPNFPQFFFVFGIATGILSRILRLLTHLRQWKNEVFRFVPRPLHMTAFWLGAISLTISLPPLLITYIWHTLNARQFNFAVNEMGSKGPLLFAKTGPGIVWLSVCIVVLFLCLLLDLYDVPTKRHEHLIALITDLTESAFELAALGWSEAEIEVVSSRLDADIKQLLSGLTVRNVGRKLWRMKAMQKEFEQLFLDNNTNELIELYDIAVKHLNHDQWDIRTELVLSHMQQSFGIIEAVKRLKKKTERVFQETGNKITQVRESKTREPRKKKEKEEEKPAPAAKVEKKPVVETKSAAMNVILGGAPPPPYWPAGFAIPYPYGPVPPAIQAPAPVPAPQAEEKKETEPEAPPKVHPNPKPVQIAQKKERVGCLIQ